MAEVKSEGRKATAAIIALLDEKVGALTTVLRTEVDPAHYVSVAKSAISRNQDLLECTAISVYSCLFDAARLGLDVDPRTGEFYLIARKNKHLGGMKECTGLIGYRGFVTLGKRSGLVEHVEARVVYEDEVNQDLVRLDLATGSITHPHAWTGIDRSPDKIVGAYAVAWLPNVSRPVIEPLTREEIDRRRKVSATADKPGRPWTEWPIEMSRKTAIRALFGRGSFPLSTVCATPRAITAETPRLTLADAMEIDDSHARARSRIADVVTVEVDEAAEEATGPVPAGEVVEEGPEPKEQK